MWTYTDYTTLIPNLMIRGAFKDGVLIHYRIYPVDGYVLRIPELDEYQTDKDGNYILDGNGERILLTPYRSYGGATEMPNYDWTLNPCGYYAELYEEGMIVFGNPEDNKHEVI